MTRDEAEVAALAARWVVEEGQDFGSAKRRAAKVLGVRGSLPDNEAIEDAVREHLATFCADSQPLELRALRGLALRWMQQLQEFRPHVVGAVWRGTANRLSDVQLQLFCDDPKAAELALIDRRIAYEPRELAGFTGQPVPVLSVHSWCADLQEEVGVHLMIYDLDDWRRARRRDGRGEPLRGSAQELAQRLESMP